MQATESKIAGRHDSMHKKTAMFFKYVSVFYFQMQMFF